MLILGDKSPAMAEQWRDRLREAVERKGKSLREISLSAGCGPGYLFDILESTKEPSIGRLMRLADALDVTLPWLLYGTNISAEEERFLRAYAKLSPRQRQAILDLANADDDQGSPSE
jgi:transcriptional regulator with XRE-family HTH domain